VVAYLHYVAIGEEALCLDPLTVDVGAVQAAVHQEEALRSAQEIGVTSRHVLAVNRDVRGRPSPNAEGSGADQMRLPVGKRNEAPRGQVQVTGVVAARRQTDLQIEGRVSRYAFSDEESASSGTG
jgi:hypothetical protein